MNRRLAILFSLSALAAMPAFADEDTAMAAERVVPELAVYEGSVEAVDQATVSAQTSGRVVEVLYDVDDFVPEGAVILRLRDTEQRARLAQAEAALREAQTRFDEARAEYERFRDLIERRLVSKSDFDRASAAHEAAKARFEAARAARDQATEQLSYAEVRAPYAGIVTARHVEAGETVAPGQRLMSGLSLDRLRVVTAIPQRDIQAVRGQGRVWVMFRQGGVERRVEGETLTIFPYADAASHSFRARIDLNGRETGLLPGMSVKTAFAVGERRALVVPSAALLRRGEMTAVYVVDGEGSASLRQVRAGRTDAEGHVEILSGLVAGERVALDPIAAGIRLKRVRGDD